MGKTLYITRMAEKLQACVPGHNPLITIPIYGPAVTLDTIMECLMCHESTSLCTILHIDISPLVRYHSFIDGIECNVFP